MLYKEYKSSLSQTKICPKAFNFSEINLWFAIKIQLFIILYCYVRIYILKNVYDILYMCIFLFQVFFTHILLDTLSINVILFLFCRKLDHLGLRLICFVIFNFCYYFFPQWFEWYAIRTYYVLSISVNILWTFILRISSKVREIDFSSAFSSALSVIHSEKQIFAASRK